MSLSSSTLIMALGDEDFRMMSTSSFDTSAMGPSNTNLLGSPTAASVSSAAVDPAASADASGPRRKKSVDFTLFHPGPDDDRDGGTGSSPHKRIRLAAPPPKWTPKQVVDALATCLTRAERLEAIRNAIDAFSHDAEVRHNQEMAAGADAALLKHLVFVAHMAGPGVQSSPRRTAAGGAMVISTELALTVQAMELVYRSSSTLVRASFLRMGTMLLQLLLDGMEQEMNRRVAALAPGRGDYGDDDNDNNNGGSGDSSNPQADYDYSQDADLFLQHATKLLGHFARVGDAIRTLATFPRCLPMLVRLCQPPYSAVPWQARLSALWTLANLACSAENMEQMLAQDGLVEALVKVACRPLYRSDSASHNLEHIMELLRGRNIASRAILNLSWSPENKIVLAENTVLLDLMAELSVHRQAPLPSSQTVSGILQSTRRHAVGALRNLAAAPKRIKLQLCAYRNGHLLDVLTDAALNDPDAHVKERAFAAIHNMAIQDTAERIVNHPALVLALRDVLLSSDATSEEEAAMKKHASSTILVLERTITPAMDAYENLRDLLQAINPAPVESDSEQDRASMTSDDDEREVAAV